jgi:hypothetical protein
LCPDCPAQRAEHRKRPAARAAPRAALPFLYPTTFTPFRALRRYRFPASSVPIFAARRKASFQPNSSRALLDGTLSLRVTRRLA